MYDVWFQFDLTVVNVTGEILSIRWHWRWDQIQITHHTDVHLVKASMTSTVRTLSDTDPVDRHRAFHGSHRAPGTRAWERNLGLRFLAFVFIESGTGEVRNSKQRHRRYADQSNNNSGELGLCRNCGRAYPHPDGRETCPAWGKPCCLCSKPNHFARQCRCASQL